MPNPESKTIPVWPTFCSKIAFTDETSLSTSHVENCIMQVKSGKCTVFCRDKQAMLSVRSMVMLGRDTAARLVSEPGQSCECVLLRYAHTYTRPNLDLNHLCLDVSSVDSFLGQKGRFCVLNDKEYCYLVMGALQYEWNHQEPERNPMIFNLMQELLIKLARSFHAHNRVTGISYLTKARSYILDHYHQPLSLDEIARASGISRSYLTGLFKRYMKRSVVDYIQAVRCDHAAFLLSTTSFAIVDIAVETGFNNRQHFARTFQKIYEISPHEYRNTYHARPVNGRGAD